MPGTAFLGLGAGRDHFIMKGETHDLKFRRVSVPVLSPATSDRLPSEKKFPVSGVISS
jgi:hypothetical protein